MSDVLSLLQVTAGRIEAGIVMEAVGGGKYRVTVRGKTVIAVAAIGSSENIRIGLPAILSLSDGQWYIIGQPMGATAGNRVEIIIRA